jgi:hypothetical protein
LVSTCPWGWTRTARPGLRGARRALLVHFRIDADGFVRDAALGGIGPDVMATGLGTILPGVGRHA